MENYKLAVEAQNKYNHALAIDLFSKVIDEDPRNVWSYCGRGESYQQIGEHKKAIRDFTIALQLDSEEELAKDWSRFFCGVSYAKIEQYDKALEYFNVVKNEYGDIFELQECIYNCQRKIAW